ncbi:N-acetyltransferase [Cellulosimicrobium terreum]|nr:N-acetyltransferase [Cellulosimicrobium terreum]
MDDATRSTAADTTRADTTVEVVDAGDRFEARTPDGGVAGFAAYVRQPGTVVFTHTEVDPAYEGQGVGSALVAGALDQVRAAGEVIVPLCPFVKAWVGRHPDYQDLVRAP